MRSSHTSNVTDDSAYKSPMDPIEETSARKSSVYTSVFLRVAASVVFIPCFVIITRTGGYHFLALIDIILFVGMWEFYRMMEAKGIHPYKAIGILCGLALSWYMFFRNGMYANLFLTAALLAIMAMELTRRETKLAIFHISTTLLGVIYVAFLGSHLVMLRELPLSLGLDYGMGAAFVFLTFIITWAGDAGAFFVGTFLGRHPLMPKISGKKTVEGSLGGLAFSVAAAAAAQMTFVAFLSLSQALVLGLAAGIIGQVGDLFESLIKRDAEIKDSSATIPGHGGVLDRFDSLLFTAPLIYYFMKFVVFK